MSTKYYIEKGGLPPQTKISEDKSIFTTAYAYIPRLAQKDIVTTRLPFFSGERVWILARPLSGFAETFSQYIVELQPSGGSDTPEPNPQAEAVIFVVGGELTLTVEGAVHILAAGGYAYIPAGSSWKMHNAFNTSTSLHWIRKAYQDVDGIERPEFFVTNDQDVKPIEMPDSDGKWSTTRFVDPTDVRHDMHVNIVNFMPDGLIPFDETHVMEHGLYVLEGKADYRVNQDWISVSAGDFLWLRAFCPQSCIARGDGPFRYLLYKDMHRHPKLDL